ncbi:MAG: AMP-binding protein [Pseudomonadota bacterium]
MYDMRLTEAYFPAQTDMEVLETTVGGVLRDAASRAPDAPAMLEVGVAGETGRSWTYAELLAEAEALARAFSTRFAPRERIAVWAPNAPEWVLIEYAAALAGLSLVTANPAYQTRELRYVLEQSGAVALFHVASFRGNPMETIAREAAEGLPKIRELVDMEDPAAMARRGDRPDALHEATPDDEAQIQYTSGTTGFPKGARLHHRGLTNNARFFAARAEMKEREVWGGVMPLFHTAGCAMCVLGPAQTLGKLVLFRAFDPNVALDRIEAEGINTLTGVPTMLVAMMEAQAAKPRDVSAIRMAVSGGSMVAPELVRSVCAAFDCGFQVVYGQTEASPVLTQHFSTDAPEVVSATVGQSLPQGEISIRRTGSNEVAATGEVGEVCLRGYAVMLGYNDDPEATAAAIDADGWLHTGDLGTMDAKGYVALSGRVKEMIIRGGENLFPAEIENALLEHPDVAECAVFGLPDPKWGEVVACAIRPEPGASPRAAALKAHCRDRLAPQKSPVVWSLVEAFPLTGSGKIRKFELARMQDDGELKALE